MERESIETSWGRVGCTIRGSGGVPLLFLHGVGSDRTAWNGQVERFAAERMAIAVDMPGYGDSQVGSGDPRSDFAAAALAVLDALEVPQAHVCGLSLGGVIALAMHARAPERIASLAAAPVADAGAHLSAMRAVKFTDELACIRRAIRATEAGHLCARTALQAGRTELEVYAEVQAAITRAAGEPVVMLGDFAAGKRTESGGGPPTANVLRTGDLMIFDIFPVIGGYRADITNTLCVGAPTHSQQQHMLALQAAMHAAEGELRPGVTGAQVYAACRASLAAAGLGAAFPHHAGHGLGLGHPEAPFLVEHSTDTLQAGNVVTLEPGAYIKGWGGARIEHNYLITTGGFERLSQHQIGF